MTFTGRILFLGCGSVTQCSLPLLLREQVCAPQRITVLDMVDNRNRVAGEIAQGVTYVVDRITPDNLDELLSRYVGPGDICLDLAWNIDTCTILDWCRGHGVRYLNTSVEVWDPYDDASHVPPLDRTLYVRHMAMRRMIARWGDNKGPSAVVEHGANPGLVSHWTKQALVEIGEAALRDSLVPAVASARLETALAEREFPVIAQLLDVRAIHIAERDTQVTSVPKQVDEFVNTWSVEGFYEEGVAPAEMGWGTHERRLPPDAHVHAGEGPGNQICLARMGAKTWVRSRVPSGEIMGMVIRHGEAFTITDRLTVWDEAPQGSRDRARPLYRPTVHYAYCPSDSAIASMHELEMRQWVMQPAQRILNDEIDSGIDELGVLLMGHPYQSWWTGSQLSIDEARTLVPHQNATTLQVAASVLGAVRWMIASPTEGVCVPDDLPYEDVLAAARPYLGPQFSGPIDWNPLQSRVDLFADYAERHLDPSDPWQFTNYLVL